MVGKKIEIDYFTLLQSAERSSKGWTDVKQTFCNRRHSTNDARENTFDLPLKTVDAQRKLENSGFSPTSRKFS